MFRSIKAAGSIKGKVVLLRSDLNVETTKDSFKLSRALPTIEYLKKKGAIVLLMSHRGRPKGVDPKQSLTLVLPYLKRAFGRVSFIGQLEQGAIADALKGARPGDILLLENVRFHSGEDACDKEWAQELASVGDIYVNDAFASHHEGATVSVLPTLLPSYAGLQMEAEVEMLSRAMKGSRKPLVVILAGGKAADKFAVINYLYKRTKVFLVGGVLANTFFKAAGIDVDKSIYDEEILPLVAARRGDRKIVLPMDWLFDGNKILDLGPLSSDIFARVLKTAGTIIWNGPLGMFEDKRFRGGSVAIARAVASSKAFSLVGGGETTSLIMSLRLEKKIGFLSTGGGAMLSFLAGKPHAGLKALGYKGGR